LSEGAKQFIRQYVPADDSKDVIVTFEIVNEFKPAKSRIASEVAGKPVEIYEDVVFIRKNVRGTTPLKYIGPSGMRTSASFHFPGRNFKKGEKAAARGTPLNKLVGMHPSILRQYHALNVFTIEDLALVSDIGLQNLGTGSRELRRAAIEWVERMQPVTPTASDPQLLDLVARMDAKLDSQQATIEKLMEENAKLKR